MKKMNVLNAEFGDEIYETCHLFNRNLQQNKLDFCLTVHHQLGKAIQMNQLDVTMIY